tara:strand:+ start:74 stop:274 length:201 start_codon:yes stop_codon:yes gene_type:complete
MIRVYRYINDISLNGREYLVDENDKTLNFSNISEILKYYQKWKMKFKDEEELEDYGIYLDRENEDD